MVTIVGTQKSFIEAIKSLIELNYDVVGAYDSAIKNLENPEFKPSFQQFKLDHEKHIKELSQFLLKCNETFPTGPDTLKRTLQRGKVELASLFGDQNILNAMLSNEEDSKIAYERINARIGEASDNFILKIISNGLADEKKHKHWLQSNILQKTVQ